MVKRIHVGSSAFLPVLAGKLVVGRIGGGYKEEVAKGPKLLDKVNLLHLHHAHHSLYTFNGGVDAIGLEYLVKSRGEHRVVGFEYVLAVEPLSLNIVELGTALRAF